MKKYLDGLKQGLGIMTIIILSIFGVYLVKAWSGTDGLTAGAGDLLTYDKWNQLLSKINAGVGGIVYNSGTNNVELNGGIKIAQSTVCNSSNKGVLRYLDSTSRLEYCDGTNWNYMYSVSTAIGDAGNPATSCLQIKNANPSAASKSYWINNSGLGLKELYCDMTSDGGGWTLVARITGDRNHINAAEVQTISSESQSVAAKLSDAYINALKTSSGGYRLKCGSNQYIFNYQCPFSASSANGNSYCHIGSDKVNRGGVSNRVGSPGIIYSYPGGSTLGCRSESTNWGGSGTLRVK